jgi:hypothetical protein
MIYNFKDLQTVFFHPSYGQYIASGSGIGTITFTMATDRTVQDVAADGRVMSSKVEGENGSIAIAIQQTSQFHKWLQGLYNYLKSVDASEWTQLTITADSAVMGDNNQCTGCGFQKRADLPYQAQGQLVTYTILAESVFES